MSPRALLKSKYFLIESSERSFREDEKKLISLKCLLERSREVNYENIFCLYIKMLR